jgi:hypothetical protein
MTTRTTAAGSPIRGKVTVSVFDTDELHDALDDEDYSELSEYERWLLTRDPGEFGLEALNYEAERGLARSRAAELLATRPPEADVEETTNTTVDGLHEYIVGNLDPTQAVDLNVTHLAVGNDDTAPTTSDTTLTNEVHRTEITDIIDNGNDFTTSTFLDSSEANGYTLNEVGLFTDDGTADNLMVNHALITSIEKDSTKTATIDVELQFRAT